MERLRDAWFWLVGRIGASGLVRRLHRLLYRRLGGAGILGRSLGNLSIVLITVGRRSGETREAPLWAYPDGERLVVVGTNGGKEAVPAWVLNLRTRPEAQVRLLRALRPVGAYEASGEEWDRLWALVVAAYPGYAAYRRWIHRPVPLVVLTATDGKPLVVAE